MVLILECQCTKSHSQERYRLASFSRRPGTHCSRMCRNSPTFKHGKYTRVPRNYRNVRIFQHMREPCVPGLPSPRRRPGNEASYRHKQIFLPEAICCCSQTCKCGFYIRVVLCTSVPSLIVRNANLTKL